MKIGNQEFELGKRTYIMGILNVTPDSFSDGGSFHQLENAIKHAKQMAAEGADIIDVGGESTRPGHAQISEQEEIKRIVPVVEALKSELPNVPLSIDTYKPSVLEAAIKAGADMINDIWGFQQNEKMAELAAKYKLPCCLMHNRSSNHYQDLMADFLADLDKCVQTAFKHGIDKNKIILDPGIGFAKTYEQNLIILNNLEQIKNHFDYPVLLGTSRKSTIGKALLYAPVNKRLEGTLATTAIGIMKGCDFIRVHDVRENKNVCLMTDAIKNSSNTNKIQNLLLS